MNPSFLLKSGSKKLLVKCCKAINILRISSHLQLMLCFVLAVVFGTAARAAGTSLPDDIAIRAALYDFHQGNYLIRSVQENECLQENSTDSEESKEICTDEVT